MDVKIKEKKTVRKESKSFSSVMNAQDLKKYLSSAARDKVYIHHYTTIDALSDMLDSNYFVFSNSERTNDIGEFNRHQQHNRKVYSACFSRDSDENVAMWGMYAIPWEIGVRISIPTKELRRWLKEAKDIFIVSEDYHFSKPHSLIIRDKKIINVCYVNQNNSRLSWSSAQLYTRNKPELENWITNSELVEYIKDEAWKYEAEVRVVLTTDDTIKYSGYALPLTEEFISTWKITLSPKFDAVIPDNIAKNGIRVEQSRFNNLIVPKTICKKCKHKKFEFRQFIVKPV